MTVLHAGLGICIFNQVFDRAYKEVRHAFTQRLLSEVHDIGTIVVSSVSKNLMEFGRLPFLHSSISSLCRVVKLSGTLVVHNHLALLDHHHDD